MSAAWDLSVDMLDLASLTRITQYGWGKEYANKGHGGWKKLLSQLFLTAFPLEIAGW